MLLNRYLGGKTELLPSIMEVARELCSPGDRVLDAFTGSLAVSMAFKREGFEVVGTDLNLLSHTYSKAYLLPTDPDDFGLDIGLVDDQAIKSATIWLDTLRALPGWAFLHDTRSAAKYKEILALLVALQEVQIGDLPKLAQQTHFFDAYSPEGARAAFTSSRGSTGTRRFFTGGNALRLDAMMNQLRVWREQEVMTDATLSLLTAVVCTASEKVANTQGTWHDFPRQRWDSRAFKDLTLKAPALDSVFKLGHLMHDHGRETDVMEYVKEISPVRLAYYDPPYNFRQYTAYYHLPNLICRYPYLNNPGEYFDGLTFVRGQNMVDDRSSAFCGSRTFVPALRNLLATTPSEYVLLSYFTGRNHWSEFDSGPDDTGLHVLTDLLSDGDLFVPGSQHVIRIPRTNYASYGGYTARTVDELLLVAQRRDPATTQMGTLQAGREYDFVDGSAA